MKRSNMRARALYVGIASSVLVALGACSRETEEPATAEAPAAEEAASPAASAQAASSPFMPIEMGMKEKMSAAAGSSAEQTWALKMIPHHQGALDMSQALLKQSPNGPMHEMAQKTIAEQTKDIAELEKWVQSHPASGGQQVNPFAETEQQMHQKMMAASGPDAYRTWALKMIEHHQGAVDMARRVLQDAKDPEVRRMAQKTIDMQSKDIEKLRSMASG